MKNSRGSGRIALKPSSLINHVRMNKLWTVLFSLVFASASAQDNYEIQVYGSQTQARKSTMFELHSNFTFDGEKDVSKGVLPSNHALHETLEITNRDNKCF